jgi:O-antigen/teichoic acid export membrane protein
MLKDLLKYIPSQLVTAVVGFASITVLTRLFSPDVYGDYSLIKAVTGAAAVATAWIGPTLVRFAAEYRTRGRFDVLFRSAFLLETLLMLLVCVGGVAYAYVVGLSGDLRSLLYVSLAAFFVGSLYQELTLVLRADRRIGLFTVFDTWRVVGSFGLGLALVVGFDSGISGVFWGGLIANLLLFVPLWRRTAPPGRVADWGVDKGVAREVFGYGLPLALGTLSKWLIEASDRVIIKQLGTSAEVGLYSALYSVASQGFAFLAALFYLADRPLAMQVWAREGDAGVQRFMTNLVRSYLAICVPVAALGVALSGPFLRLVVGPEYAADTFVFPLILASSLLTGLATRFQIPALIAKKTGVMVTFTFSSGLLSIGLNYTFIPLVGYRFAAVANLLAALAYTVANLVYARRCHWFPLAWKSAFRVVGVSAVAGLSAYLTVAALPFGPLVQLLAGGTVGVLVVAGLALVTGEITRSDLQRLRAALARRSSGATPGPTGPEAKP